MAQSLSMFRNNWFERKKNLKSSLNFEMLYEQPSQSWDWQSIVGKAGEDGESFMNLIVSKWDQTRW
jgi:hypothetical protein